jgi:hypothetical protein
MITTRFLLIPVISGATQHGRVGLNASQLIARELSERTSAGASHNCFACLREMTLLEA